MVFKNKSKQTGTGLRNSVLLNMLNASYKSRKETPQIIQDKKSRYYLDIDRTTDEVKTYFNKNKNKL
jgi:hypothetical protein